MQASCGPIWLLDRDALNQISCVLTASGHLYRQPQCASCLVVTASKMNGLTFLVVLALPIICDIYMHDCFVLQQRLFQLKICRHKFFFTSTDVAHHAIFLRFLLRSLVKKSFAHFSAISRGILLMLHTRTYAHTYTHVGPNKMSTGFGVRWLIK